LKTVGDVVGDEDDTEWTLMDEGCGRGMDERMRTAGPKAWKD
jgi:hypothetical protein